MQSAPIHRPYCVQFRWKFKLPKREMGNAHAVPMGYRMLIGFMDSVCTGVIDPNKVYNKFYMQSAYSL